VARQRGSNPLLGQRVAKFLREGLQTQTKRSASHGYIPTAHAGSRELFTAAAGHRICRGIYRNTPAAKRVRPLAGGISRGEGTCGCSAPAARAAWRGHCGGGALADYLRPEGSFVGLMRLYLKNYDRYAEMIAYDYPAGTYTFLKTDSQKTSKRPELAGCHAGVPPPRFKSSSLFQFAGGWLIRG
jgi:hypothetical protein